MGVTERLADNDSVLDVDSEALVVSVDIPEREIDVEEGERDEKNDAVILKDSELVTQWVIEANSLIGKLKETELEGVREGNVERVTYKDDASGVAEKIKLPVT